MAAVGATVGTGWLDAESPCVPLSHNNRCTCVYEAHKSLILGPHGLKRGGTAQEQRQQQQLLSRVAAINTINMQSHRHLQVWAVVLAQVRAALPQHLLGLIAAVFDPTNPGSHRLPDQARQVSTGPRHIQVAPAAEEL